MEQVLSAWSKAQVGPLSSFLVYQPYFYSPYHERCFHRCFCYLFHAFKLRPCMLTFHWKHISNFQCQDSGHHARLLVASSCSVPRRVRSCSSLCHLRADTKSSRRARRITPGLAPVARPP